MKKKNKIKNTTKICKQNEIQSKGEIQVVLQDN